jgi:hypothetical protein
MLPAWVAGGAPADARPGLVHRLRLRALAPALLSAAMPGVGVLLYSAYVWRLTGEPLAWAAGHVAWGRQYEGVGTLFSDHFEYLSEVGVYAYTSQLPADVLNALGALFAIGLAWPVARRLGLAYAVFILVNILPPLAAGGFLSAGRFSSVLFPTFIWLAGAMSPPQRVSWTTAFMALQGFVAVLFYTWRPMF